MCETALYAQRFQIWIWGLKGNLPYHPRVYIHVPRYETFKLTSRKGEEATPTENRSLPRLSIFWMKREGESCATTQKRTLASLAAGEFGDLELAWWNSERFLISSPLAFTRISRWSPSPQFPRGEGGDLSKFRIAELPFCISEFIAAYVFFSPLKSLANGTIKPTNARAP